jgi:hypothetical protein
MTCRFANDCPHTGTVLVRIHSVGDRKVCPEHLAWMRDQGMDFRELADVFVPRWRQGDLRRSMDRSSRIVA